MKSMSSVAISTSLSRERFCTSEWNRSSISLVKRHPEVQISILYDLASMQGRIAHMRSSTYATFKRMRLV
jgi:hypothetical protein